jgi:hypothetical protein
LKYLHILRGIALNEIGGGPEFGTYYVKRSLSMAIDCTSMRATQKTTKFGQLTDS